MNTTQTNRPPSVRPKPTVETPHERPTPREFSPQEQAIFAEFGLGPNEYRPPSDSAGAPQPHDEPSRLSRVLANANNPEFDTLRLCDLADTTVRELRELLSTDRADHALDDTRRIARRRLEIILTEAETAAWSRLLELARSNPITAGERETARKAAAQIIRELPRARAALQQDPTPDQDHHPETTPQNKPDIYSKPTRDPTRESPPSSDTRSIPHQSQSVPGSRPARPGPGGANDPAKPSKPPPCPLTPRQLINATGVSVSAISWAQPNRSAQSSIRGPPPPYPPPC